MNTRLGSAWSASSWLKKWLATRHPRLSKARAIVWQIVDFPVPESPYSQYIGEQSWSRLSNQVWMLAKGSLQVPSKQSGALLRYLELKEANVVGRRYIRRLWTKKGSTVS